MSAKALYWQVSHRADPVAKRLADRHYSRQNPESNQFVSPGRCMVLYTPARGGAYWVTSWPFAQYVKHDWPGAWICSAFRNEGRVLSSVLIRQAVRATRWRFGDAPAFGMVTFVDESKVRPKEQPGRCFIEAGFEPCGMTKGGLLAFQLLPERMPDPQPPIGGQLNLLEGLAA